MKKFLSILLAVMMVVTVLPVNALTAPLELEEHTNSEEEALPEEPAEQEAPAEQAASVVNAETNADEPEYYTISVDSNIDTEGFENCGTIRWKYWHTNEDGETEEIIEYSSGGISPIQRYAGITLTAIPRAGYEFDGWYKNDANGELITNKKEYSFSANAIYASYTQYANFKVNENAKIYTVSFVTEPNEVYLKCSFPHTVKRSDGLEYYVNAGWNAKVEEGWGLTFEVEIDEQKYYKGDNFAVVQEGVGELTADNGKYTISNITGDVKIIVKGIETKPTPVIEIDDIPDVQKGEKLVVTGTIKNDKGEPVPDGEAEVIVMVNYDTLSKTVTLGSDGKFRAEFETDNFAPGEYDAIVEYSKGSRYENCSNIKTFNLIGGHEHCICGGENNIGDHKSHSTVRFTKWTGGSITYTNNTTYLYIPKDTTVTLTEDLFINGTKTMYLCLEDGAKIQSDGTHRIIVTGESETKKAKLVICGCGTEKGTITGASGIVEGGCVAVYRGELDVFGVNMGGSSNIEKGGAIYANDKYSTVKIYDAHISNCTNIKNGGAIYLGNNLGDDGTYGVKYCGQLYLYGGVIENNSATENGGAIYIPTYANTGSIQDSLKMYGGTIKNNTAGGNGGGLYAEKGSGISIWGGEFSYNRAKNGGGIYFGNNGSNNKALFVVTNTTIAYNNADECGGGMYGEMLYTLNNIAFAPFQGNTIVGNTAKKDGGGMYMKKVSTTITNCVIKDNKALEGDGGGVYAAGMQFGTSGTTEIGGNIAKENGGGVFLTSNGSSTILTVTAGKFTGNSASVGGGICVANKATAWVNNESVIKDNTADSGSEICVGITETDAATVEINDKVTVSNSNADTNSSIKVYPGATFIVNNGNVDVVGKANAIDGKITVKGGSVKAFAPQGTAFSEKATVAEGMGAKHGADEASAQRVEIANIDWSSKFIHIMKACTITFDANGHGTAPESITAFAGEEVTNLPTITAEGWEFEGWYFDKECTKPFSESPVVTGDTTLYAKWAESTTPKVTYEWIKTANGYDCTAKQILKNTVLAEEIVHAVLNEIIPADCETDGTGKYYAYFTSDWAETQEKDVTLPAKGHDWDRVLYDWNETDDGFSVTASRLCNHCSKEQKETVDAVYTVETPATCEEDGRGKYTATFTFDWAETQTSYTSIPALGHKDEDKNHICDNCGNQISDHTGGTATCVAKAVCEICGKPYGEVDPNNHDWAAATYEWTETANGYTVTAKHICKSDAKHIETEAVAATYAVVTPAACLTNGLGRYTAQFKNTSFETQTKDIVLNATGHDWAAAAYEWTETANGYNATAKRVCKNNAKHIETETAAASYAVVTPATCLTNGLGRYTATFKADWASTQTKDIVLNATGHDWAAAAYEWTETTTGYTATAKRVCKNDKTHVETETATASYAVVTPATCLANGLGRYTAQFKADWASAQTKDIVLNATGHDWQAATYEWTETANGYTVTAKRVCKNNAKHIETETAAASYAVVTPAACLANGLGRYTAQFKADWATVQTKDIVLNATGHDWAAATYEWTETTTGYTATAKRVCKNDKAHVETETATASYAVVTPATCLANGLGRYTATFNADWASAQTKDIVLNATGHDWAATAYEWTETANGYNATAKRICKNDKAHVETETATASYAVVTPATCLENGLGRYTATFKAAWASTQIKDIVLDATGHDWAAATYEWTETTTGYTATAKRVCKNDKAHVETETATASYAVVTPATCLANGLGRYTATFKAAWASAQTKDITIPAKGHDHSGHWRYNEFEHWRICPVCKDIIDVWAHDLTDWKMILDNHGKDTNREERHCRICAYEQYSTTIHIGGTGKNETTETNPNTGAEVFLRSTRAAFADNRVNSIA